MDTSTETGGDVTTRLEQIRERHRGHACDEEHPLGICVHCKNRWPCDSYRLLAAVDAALKDHRKSMFPAGPPGAGDAYGKHYCAGICYTAVDDQVVYRVWPCPAVQAITAALAGTSGD